MGEAELIEKGVLSRYDLSYYSCRQLQRDHIRFEEKYTATFTNTFICRILINYMCYAQDNLQESFEADISQVLEQKQYTDRYFDGRVSFTSELTKKMQEFDFVYRKGFKKRTVITYILDRFTALPFSEREIVYCYFQYKVIKQCINENEMLLITNSNNNKFEVKPYEIMFDDNSFSYYLIGYSRKLGSDGEFECHSFKLSRIREVRSSHKSFILTGKDKAAVRKVSDKYGAAYTANDIMEKNIENTVVRLTSKGYNTLFLKVISHQRPIPVSEPKTVFSDGIEYHDLEFDCSYEQIRNYFFSFGAEAEIITPYSLRERFVSDYQKTLQRYQIKYR